jgi:hypothetical protein
MYKLCDVKIPKSGKKLITIQGRDFFVRPLKKLLYIYDVKTKVLITVCPDENKQIAFKRIIERMEEIRKLDDILSTSMGVP